MKYTYTVSGMHCGSCVGKIESALRGLDAVETAEVTLDPPEAVIEMEPRVALDELNETVGRQGSYRLDEKSTSNAPGIHSESTAEEGGEESLYPLVLIVAYILATVLLVAWHRGNWEPMTVMRHFMAGFFLVFSFFKLLDVNGFVSAYRGYDLLARRSAVYARLYPFVELGLGVAYLLNAWPFVTNIVTLVLMLIGSAGVLKALLDKRAIRCACLGTALNLPMTKVTLVEDLTMAVMAAVMIVLHLN